MINILLTAIGGGHGGLRVFRSLGGRVLISYLSGRRRECRVWDERVGYLLKDRRCRPAAPLIRCADSSLRECVAGVLRAGLSADHSTLPPVQRGS